jgi:hypothetical protein
MIERKEEEALIPVRLDDADKLAIAHKAAELRVEIDAMRNEAAAVSKEWKERIKAKDEDLRRYLAGVQHGTLEQTVGAERVIDKENGLTWLEYAGDRYQTRELTAEERTEALF